MCGQQKQSNDPHNNQHNPQYANYWAPLTRKRHIPPHSAQPRHTNDWAPRTRKRHQQEHRPQRPTERSDPTQHAKGRPGDCPGPRKETTTRQNVTQGGGGVSLRQLAASWRRFGSTRRRSTANRRRRAGNRQQFPVALPGALGTTVGPHARLRTARGSPRPRSWTTPPAS